MPLPNLTLTHKQDEKASWYTKEKPIKPARLGIDYLKDCHFSNSFYPSSLIQQMGHAANPTGRN